MRWKLNHRAERAVDAAAAILLSVAVGFAVVATGSGVGPAMMTGVTTFMATFFGLKRISPEAPAFALPVFPLRTFTPVHDAADELILDDELAEVGPHARVVRLFGPGQGHLPSGHEAPDASQALVEALAELRRSML